MRTKEGGREDFHSDTAVRNAMFSPEKSRRAENWRRGSGFLARTSSSAVLERMESSLMSWERS